MRNSRFLTASLLLVAAAVSAQTVTGELSGFVTSESEPLAGATITIESPALQGVRTAISSVNGSYKFPVLPPGIYTITFELEGLQTVTKTVRVSLAGIANADADLRLAAVSEAITVHATAPNVMKTTEVQQNVEKKLVDELPVGRTVEGIAELAPGVTTNGPNHTLQISGSFANDNLILINGANIQENFRGQARPLYIEDAIQETTVISGSVSAEYGRFTGGVISSVTKSGGNDYSGTLRNSFTNPAWSNPSAHNEERAESKNNDVWEATFGGRIVTDRLWFFTAGRYENATKVAAYERLSGTPIMNTTENQRSELKLTGQVTESHSIIADYLDNPLTQTGGYALFGAYEVQALDPEVSPNEDFFAAHYNGVFGTRYLGEIHYSKRDYVFVGYGGTNSDLYEGTPLYQRNGGNGVANAPFFCDLPECEDAIRNNELVTAKISSFLSTAWFGSHDIIAGYDRYIEESLENNYQSATDLIVEIWGAPAYLNEQGVPIFTFSEFDDVIYNPVMVPTVGSEIGIESVFINDKWDLNRHLSFNVGIRYDKTVAENSSGNPTADDDGISPRLGVIYDVSGDGRLRLNAGYSEYVGRLADKVQAQGSAGGQPWGIYYYYDGPPITGTSAEVVRAAVDWFVANGGTDFANWQGTYPLSANIGGVNRDLADDLVAPSAREWTLGAAWQITGNSFVRANYVDRDWSDYYGAFTNSGTGQITLPIIELPIDRTLIDNTDLFTRTYKAIDLAARTTFLTRYQAGLNYTWSQLNGNAEGENVFMGPTWEGGWILEYPEFNGFIQNRPSGYLPADQTHKLRAWLGADFDLGRAGLLNVTLLERFDSGEPYSIAGNIRARRDPATGTEPLGYVSPPQTSQYYFGGRGSERWDDASATDVAINYEIPIAQFFAFFQGEVINLFDEQAQTSGNTTIYTSVNQARTECRDASGAPMRCLAFNPFTETPVLGTHYAIPATFGTAIGPGSYQTPLTYRFSVGLRF